MNKVLKSVLSVSAAVAVATASLTPVIVAAYGDNTGTKEGRPTYTIDEINANALGDKITFNSISNGKIGDERYFVGGALAGTNVSSWASTINNVKDGEVYTIRLYVHNNSPRGMQAIAENVKATFSLPTTVSKSHTVVGYLDSSNATPTRYFDEVYFNSDQDFYLEYVDGSARYKNTQGTFNLSNDIIINGATLGYKTMDGKIPGCYEYDGEVFIDVKVHSSVAAKLTKQVRMKGTKTWSESVEAKVGDEVEYQIEYQNLLSETVSDVMIRDVLPTNVEYVADSTYIYNESHPEWTRVLDNTLTTTGINIGGYAAKGNAFIRFTGKVVDNTMACGNNQLVNWASATVKGNVYKDDASVMVLKDGESCKNNPTPTPTPNPTPTQDNPGETPTTIVETGAGTIATGVIGAGAMTTTLGYYIASRRKLS